MLAVCRVASGVKIGIFAPTSGSKFEMSAFPLTRLGQISGVWGAGVFLFNPK